MPGPPAVYLAENRRKSRRVPSGRFWQRQEVCQKFLQGVKWTQWTVVAEISANGRGFAILMLKTSWQREIMAPSENILVVEKLGPFGKNLETVRGIDYRFKDQA
jgi:hypothetical protein